MSDVESAGFIKKKNDNVITLGIKLPLEVKYKNSLDLEIGLLTLPAIYPNQLFYNM